MSTFDDIYRRLPVAAQHAAVTVYGVYWHWLRFGPGFARRIGEYAARDRFTAEEWRVWQDRRLNEVLRIAANEIPYYKRAWDDAARSAALAGRLGDLPLLAKEHIRAEPEAFLRESVRPLPRLTFHTSGSTGTPIASIWTVDELRDSMALREARSAGWAGVSFRLPRATFSGRLVVPD